MSNKWEEELYKLSCKYANDYSDYHKNNTVLFKTELIEEELKSFISQIRQKDCEELINMLPDYDTFDSASGDLSWGRSDGKNGTVTEVKQLIQDYYNK